MTSGTPWPRASGAKLLTRKVTTMPPTTGTRMTNAPHGLGGVNTLGVVVDSELRRGTARLWMRPISARNTTAPNPVTMPTTIASRDSRTSPIRGGSSLNFIS